MGKGPCAVRITSRSFGTNSITTYVYRRVRPMNRATNSTCEPTSAGGGDIHSTDVMFAYH